MKKKNLVFVTLFESTTTYAQLSKELADSISSWFIVPTKRDKEELNSFGIPNEKILDLSINRYNFKKSFYKNNVQETLTFFEDLRLPILSIIAASRMCNEESLSHLQVYMANVLSEIDTFLKKHNIEWVIAEPSDMVQLLAQLVCWKRNISFGQISLARHPSNRIVLITDCTESSFHEFSCPNKFCIENINQWLTDFRSKNMRPAYYSRISNYRSLVSLFFSFIRRTPKIIKELSSFSELNDLRTKKLLTKYLYDLSRKYLNIGGALILDEHTLKRKKYVVYFLHVQPERSIDVMSPNFIEQMEIIKQIRRSLPWHIDLLVKDHPASDGAQPFSFYLDLKKIHGVTLVSRKVDSRILSVNSLAVATVSGTVAYEMALFNKPAVMFSSVFFSGLPSIYIYQTPDLLGVYFRNLIKFDVIQSDLDDSKILRYLEHLYQNSVISDWDGFYGFLKPSALLSISELIRKVIFIK